MSRRFFLPLPFDQPRVSITGSEAHHLSRVMRLKAGDLITLFDGSGHEALARIEGVGDEGVELAILDRRAAPEGDPFPVTLATAVPKGERFDWLIEKGTELGLSRIVPLVTARSVVVPGKGKLERLRKTIVEASKQCGRNRLMELAEPIAWNDFLARESEGAQVWVADPSGDRPDFGLCAENSAAILAVGPEGGFTEAEIESGCGAGARLVSLGPRILRIETAGLALATLIAQARRE